jgi:hypothetical protein
MGISLRSPGPRNPFSVGDVVQCVDAQGTALSTNAIYRVTDTNQCASCRGALRLDSGPRPTDSGCGWWFSKRFRHVRPPQDELTERIMRSRKNPTQAPTKETENA